MFNESSNHQGVSGSWASQMDTTFPSSSMRNDRNLDLRLDRSICG